MDKLPKVLFVHNYYQIPGGEDTVVSNEKKMLEEHGHEVVLYSRNNAELKKLSKLKKLGLPFSTVFNIRTYREVKRIIKLQKIEIVHIHNTLNLISPSVYYAALSLKVPVVQTIHNFRLLCPGATFYRDGHICEDCVVHGLSCAIKHSCYRNSKVQTLACVINTHIHRKTGIYGKLNYICLTDYNRKKLLDLKQVNADRVFVKPNFVESNSPFIPYKQRLNQFVFAGRLDKLKGINLLLQAWKLLEKERGSHVPRLVICGTGPMESWCRNYIKGNQLKLVEMQGFVSNTAAREIIAVSKALILPTQCYEGFPMSIVEAYSVSTPVVGSDIGNVGSLIQDGVTGYTCVHDSAVSLVDIILNKDFNICETTNAVYNKYYTKEKNYQQIMTIYRKAQKWESQN